MTMYSLNDWLLIYHKIKMVRFLNCSSSSFSKVNMQLIKFFVWKNFADRKQFATATYIQSQWIYQYFIHNIFLWIDNVVSFVAIIRNTIFLVYHACVSRCEQYVFCGEQQQQSIFQFISIYFVIISVVSGYRQEADHPSGVCSISLFLSLFSIGCKGYGRVGLKDASPFFQVILRIYIFSPRKC